MEFMAKCAADELVNGSWGANETPEHFTVRMSQHRMIIAACRNVIDIPYNAIEKAKKKGLL